jgi:hypothetical protein
MTDLFYRWAMQPDRMLPFGWEYASEDEEKKNSPSIADLEMTKNAGYRLMKRPIAGWTKELEREMMGDGKLTAHAMLQLPYKGTNRTGFHKVTCDCGYTEEFGTYESANGAMRWHMDMHDGS